MRAIKFRAWDETLKEMHLVTELHFTEGKVQGIRYGDATGTIGLYNAADYDLMQFTGLTDKNGKEIYEGDILKGTIYEDLEVRWGKDGWILHRRKEDLFPLGALQKQFIEVIGNIYENPNLLA